MPLLATSTAVIAAIAAVAGFALGWWPLAAWVERSIHGERMPRRTTIRIAAAVATAVTFGVLGLRFGGDAAGLWLLPALLVFAACATVLSIVDLVEKRLPNAVVFPTLYAVAALLVPATWAAGDWMRLIWALAGAFAMFAVYFVLALISPSSMGMGDVKLALVIGLLLGWFGLSAWLVGLLAAFVVGGVVAIVALVLRRVTLRGSIPFGPSMLVGALVAVVLAG
ncbi:prepilin peptidase [Agromyces sp. NPDC055520]